MKKVASGTSALLVALLALGVAPAQAQWGIAPYGGYNLEAEEFYFGTAVQFTIPATIGNSRLIASPSFDYYPFIGVETTGTTNIDASLFALNLDMLYPFQTPSSVAPYVGAGIIISRASVSVSDPALAGLDVSASDTDVGLNLKGGTFFRKGQSVQPFAEGALILSGETGFVLKGGVYFSIGK